MSVKIEYGGVALNAKESFEISADNASPISNFDNIKEESVTYENIGNPCDPYSVLLDGRVKPLEADSDIRIWSEFLSGADGVFENPLVLVLEAEDMFSSAGISFDFDSQNDVYCNDLIIEWWRDGEKLSEKEFFPNSPLFFCQKNIEFYNKLVITMLSLNMPNYRLKLHGMEHGLKIIFEGRELRNASVTHEIDSLSQKLPISVCDFTIDTKRNMDYSFQEGQFIKIWFNDELISKTFIKSANKKAKGMWQIKTEDYIGILDESNFAGDIYFWKNAYDLISEILDAANVPYEIDAGIRAESVSGYIPFSSCRDALKQVLFVIGAVVDTSHSDNIVIKYISPNVSQTIPLERMLQGIKEERKKSATAVEVVSHWYRPIQDSFTAYEAKNSGAGEGISIRFSEPLHDLSITNGEILQSGTNFAIINASEDCVLTGKKYEHSKTIKSRRNPLTLANTAENVISVKDATLVSAFNIDKVLDLCYNYYSKNNKFTAKIVDGKKKVKKDVFYGEHFYGEVPYGFFKETQKDQPTRIADTIACETEFGEQFQGVIEKQTFNLNGGILVKNTTIKQR